MRDYTLDMGRPAVLAMHLVLIAALLAPRAAHAGPEASKSGAEAEEDVAEAKEDGGWREDYDSKDETSKTDEIGKAGVSALGAAVAAGGSASNGPPPKDAPKSPSPQNAAQTSAGAPSSSPANAKTTATRGGSPPTAPAAKGAPSRAARKAKEMGANLLQGLRSSGDADGPPPGSPRAESPANTSPPPPREKLDLVALASSGYRPVFQSLGLKAGAGPDGRPAILTADGRPADERTLATLSLRLDEAPKALLKRPDFFKVLPESAYERLKRRWKGLNSARSSAFKDVGLTGGDRDFTWTRSCAVVSGDCNPYASERSYGISEDVAPETLRNIAGSGDGADGPPASRGRDASDRASKLGGLRGILSALTEKWLGGRGAVDAAPSATTDAAPGAASEDAPERGLRTIEPPEPGSGAEEAPPPAPARPPRKWPLAALGAALLGVAAWLARRKRAAAPSGDLAQ